MSKKLFVGGLSWDTTDANLNSFFASIGTVESAQVIMDKFSGRSKGFGFVEMSTEEEASKAISELNGKELDGRSINVNEARPQEERPKRDFGGGFGNDRGNDRRGGFRR